MFQVHWGLQVLASGWYLGFSVSLLVLLAQVSSCLGTMSIRRNTPPIPALGSLSRIYVSSWPLLYSSLEGPRMHIELRGTMKRDTDSTRDTII